MRQTFWLAVVAALTLGTDQAAASGFPQPRGEGRIIATYVYSSAAKAYGADGRLFDIADYRQNNLYVQGEYGLTDDLTLIVSPSYRDISIDDQDRDTSGFGFIDLGARYRVANAGDVVLSVQSAVRLPGKTFRDTMAQVSQEDVEIDFRGQAGIPFQLGTIDAFAIVEAGYRFRTDAPPNEYRGDITLGINATDDLLILGSLFNVISDGDGRAPFDDYRYHNLYASIVYDVTPRIAVQVGGHATLDGDNALRERGLLAGLWFRF